MGLALVLGIDKVIIEINNDKNIKFLGQDFIDITKKLGNALESLKSITWYS